MSVPTARWCAEQALVEPLTPQGARDALVACFEHAQRETFARAGERLGRPEPSEEDLRRQVTASVRAALRDVGGDWKHPTATQLRAVIKRLADRALAWGTPADIVGHHRIEMNQVIERAFGP